MPHPIPHLMPYLQFHSPSHPRGHKIGYIILTIIALVLIAAFFLFDLSRFTSASYVRELLLNAGYWGYLLYVIILLLSIPLPIPSTPIALVGGYIYGIWLGTALSLVAGVIGAVIQFQLVRKFGRPLVEHFVHQHHLEHFEHIIQRRGVSAALISLAIPIFPADAVSLMLGLTSIRMHTLIAVMLLGNIPRFVLVNILGNDLHTGFSARTFIALAFMAVFILIAWFREPIKRFLFKELHELEHEAKAVEKGMEQEAGKVGAEVEKVEEGAGWRKTPKKGRSGRKNRKRL